MTFRTEQGLKGGEVETGKPKIAGSNPKPLLPLPNLTQTLHGAVRVYVCVKDLALPAYPCVFRQKRGHRLVEDPGGKAFWSRSRRVWNTCANT